MKTYTSTLFLALVLTITATSTFAQVPGQIPIGGRAGSQAVKVDDSKVNTAIEPKIENSSEMTDYLQTIFSFVRQFTF